jgi:hypothetical protein
MASWRLVTTQPDSWFAVGGAPAARFALYGAQRVFHAAKGHMGGLPQR